MEHFGKIVLTQEQTLNCFSVNSLQPTMKSTHINVGSEQKERRMKSDGKITMSVCREPTLIEQSLILTHITTCEPGAVDPPTESSSDQ